MNNLTYHNVSVLITDDDDFYVFLDGSVCYDYNLNGESKTNCNITITEHSVIVELTELTKTYKHENGIVLDKEDSCFENIFEYQKNIKNIKICLKNIVSMVEI